MCILALPFTTSGVLLGKSTPLSLNFLFGGVGTIIPIQCSCLENPRDGGAWWAAIYGVAQSRTRLKRLSSSSRYNNTSKTI